MSQYFPKPYEPFCGEINVRADLSNYATKTDIKNILHVDTSNFALKSNLASLKTEVDKLDIDKLVSVPVDLSKLSDVVKTDVAKKPVFDKLVAKVNSFDTSAFVLKTKYDASGLVKKVDDNCKITEIEGKIPSITGLAKNAALTAVENKIPNISSSVKKTDHDTKITEIEKKLSDPNHDKYITASEFNTLTADVFNARLAQANLIKKTDFDTKLSSLNRKITTNNSKHLLVENEFKKLKTFDSSYFVGKSHFEEDCMRNYLVLQPIHRYFKLITNTKYISEWKSKGLSDESIKPPSTYGNSLSPLIDYLGNKI